MRPLRSPALLVSAILLASPLVGCQAAAPSTPPPANLTFLPNTVTASGSATVFAAPDEAVLDFSVSRSATRAEDALARASKVTTDIVRTAKALGIEAKDIQTTELDVFARYRREGGEQVRDGYTARISTQVLTRDFKLVGKLVDTGARVRATNVSGPRFQLSADSPVRRRVLSEAAASARADAEAMVVGGGRKLGAIVAISDGSAPLDDSGLADYGMLRADNRHRHPVDVTQVEPGRLEVNADVQAVFTLK